MLGVSLSRGQRAAIAALGSGGHGSAGLAAANGGCDLGKTSSHGQPCAAARRENGMPDDDMPTPPPTDDDLMDNNADDAVPAPGPDHL